MKKYPMTKDTLHSIIDYKKLFELQSNTVCNNVEVEKIKVKSKNNKKLLRLNRGERND